MKRPLLAVALACLTALPAAAAVTRAKPAGDPPWFRGEVAALPRLGWLPVRVVPGPPGTPEQWVPVPSLERLADVLTRSLAGAGVPEPWMALDPLPARGAPEAVVGCALEEGGLAECDAGLRAMELAVTGPSKAWRAAALELMRTHELDGLVVPSLTIADHWLHQKNLKGTKEVVLGTGHAQRVPWLTSLDTPVEVVQLGAVLLDREGKVSRAGVEGLVAVRTGIPASSAGLQRTVSPEDVDAVTAGARREDLPGAPRVTDAAVRSMVQQLLGPGRSASREP